MFKALFNKINRYNQLVDDYTDAIKISSDAGMAYVNWGIDIAETGDLGTALEKFEQAAAMAPDKPEPLNNWGVALAKLRRFDDAIDKFRAALEINPDYGPSWILWGAALLEQGDWTWHGKNTPKAIALSPNNPNPW